MVGVTHFFWVTMKHTTIDEEVAQYRRGLEAQAIRKRIGDARVPILQALQRHWREKEEELIYDIRQKIEKYGKAPVILYLWQFTPMRLICRYCKTNPTEVNNLVAYYKYGLSCEDKFTLEKVSAFMNRIFEPKGASPL